MPHIDKDLVLIAEVGKPHGIRGEVSVTYHGDSPFLLDEVEAVYLRPRARGRRPMRARARRIESWRPHKGRVLMRFEGVEDRNGAEALRDYEILMRTADLPEPDEHDIYLYEVEGLEVLLEDGSVLGEVRDVTFPGGQELWAIETPDGREVLFPVTGDFVTAVDLEARSVTIAPPPGLLDIYLGAGE